MDFGGLSLQGQKVLAALRKMHSEKLHTTVQKSVIVFSQQLPSLNVSAQECVPSMKHGEEQMNYMSCFSRGSEADTPSFHYSTHDEDDRNRSYNVDHSLRATFIHNNARLPVQNIRNSGTDIMVIPFPGTTEKKTTLELQKLNKNIVHISAPALEHEKENEEKLIGTLNKENNIFPLRSAMDRSKDMASNDEDDRNRSYNVDNSLRATFIHNNARLPVQDIRNSGTDIMVIPFPGTTEKKTTLELQKLNKNIVHISAPAIEHEKENEEKLIGTLNKENNIFPLRSVMDRSKDMARNDTITVTPTAMACKSSAVQFEFPYDLISPPKVDNSNTYKEAYEHRDISEPKEFSASSMSLNLTKRQNPVTLLKEGKTSVEKHEGNRATVQEIRIDKTHVKNRINKATAKNKCKDQKYIKDFFKETKMLRKSAMEYSLKGAKPTKRLRKGKTDASAKSNPCSIPTVSSDTPMISENVEDTAKPTKRLCKGKTDAFAKSNPRSIPTVSSDTPMISKNIEDTATKYSGNESIENVYQSADTNFNIQCNQPKTTNHFSKGCVLENHNIDNAAEMAADNPGFNKRNESEETLVLNNTENTCIAMTSNTEGILKDMNSSLAKELTGNISGENEPSCSPILVHRQVNKGMSSMSRKLKPSVSESLKNRGIKNKKCVFQAPLKKFFKDTKETAEDKLNEIVIKDVDESTIHNILLQLDTKGLLEVGFTILYREGFCQLNKPKEPSKHVHYTPKALVLSIMQNISNLTEFYYLSTDECNWPEKTIPKEFLMKILGGRCRKVCFGAQEVLLFLMGIYGFEKQDVLKWVLLDPMVGCWLLDPDQCFYHFNDVCEKLETVKKTTSGSQTSKIQACHFLQLLSTLTEKLYLKLQEQKLWKLFLDTEMKIVPIIAAMEFRGICILKEQLEKMNMLLEDEIGLLQEKAYKAAGKFFQLNSLQQVTKILFEELQLDKKANIKAKETLTRGIKSTSEPELRKLQPFHALPGIILEYRHLQKVKSTYVEAILQHCKGSYIYTSWEQASAATGRLTSSNPNLQAIPKQPIVLTNQRTLLPRSMYVPRSGYTFLAADFQHIEFRIFAHLAQDQKLIQILQQPGDIFMTLAKLWLGKTEETATFEDREKTKRIVYAVMYGAGAPKIAELLQLNIVDASNIISKFVSAFPVLKKFRNQVLVECRNQHFLRTIGGRLRMFPNIISDNNKSRAYAERQAVNFIIQGSAADLCKAAMIHTEQKLQNEPAHLLLQIHDELVWEVLDSHITKAIDIVKSTMENLPAFCGLKLLVPFPVVVTTGKTWGEMKT